ncbi:hypothetical protein [Nocardia brasiliensis]|uniref:hypothetical protein n=1 Tax=Nocardia brasiliensis TaxID=37326 RepID=UPI0024566373|nr:hypothetical protein [Nocardia brasiliensis]
MMRTRQYCYFALKSDMLSAVEMAARLQMDPDQGMVMGSRRYFYGPEGVHAALGGASADPGREGPRPLGWHLSLPVLEFLSSLWIELDVDEYDFSDDNVPGESTDE